MTKRDGLIEKINNDWTSISDLMVVTGWKSHTIRGALSTAAKRGNVKIERKREAGVTFYRAVSVEVRSS